MSEKVTLEVGTPPLLSERIKSRVSMLVGDLSKFKSLGALPRYASKNVSRIGSRRRSFGFGRVPGMKHVDRTSQVGIEFRRPLPIYSNTYQLEPHAPFKPGLVEAKVNELLDINFTGHVYKLQESPALALRLAGEIMRSVKEMEFNRYRIISVVTVGQKRSQSYNNAISFLWDHERDNYINVQRESTTVFIQVTVFGIYLD